MKYKYRLINNMFYLNDDICKQRFIKEAKNGWMLKKIGSVFFKYEKMQPKDLSFFIDYQRPTSEYIEAVKECGYHYIDNYRTLSVYYSKEINKDEMQSDEVVKNITKKEMFKPVYIFLAFLCAFLMISIITIFDYPAYFFRSFDHIIVNINMFLIYIMELLLAIFFVGEGILLLLGNIHYSRLIKGLSGKEGLIKVVCGLLNGYFIVIMLLALLMVYSLGLFTNILFYLSLVCSIVLYCIYLHLINKKIIKIENRATRKVLIILCVVGFLVVDNILMNLLDFENKSADTNSFQSDSYNYVNNYHNIFYRQDAYYGTSNQKDELDNYVTTYYEHIYHCINSDIAMSIFKTLVIDGEHASRIPEEEEIDALVDETGSFDSLIDVPFNTYQTSFDNLKQYDYQNCDLVCGYDNYYYVLKDNLVYDLMVKETTNIQQLIDYYQ